MNARRLTFLLLAGAFCLLCSAGIAAGKDRTGDLANVLRQNGYRAIPLQHSRDSGFSLSARINGKPARLAVSMASPLSVIYRDANSAFGLREEKTGRYLNSAFGRSQEEYGIASGNTIDLANMVMPTTKFAVIARSNRPAGAGRDLAGILGEAEMYRLAAILDCGNARLYLRPAGRDAGVNGIIARNLAAHGFTFAPMQINSAHHFEVPCRINSYQSEITIEPMNSITSISERSAAAGRVPLVDSTQMLVGVGGMKRASKDGIVSIFGIGSFIIPNAKVVVAEADFNVLGLDQVNKCSGIIDLGARKLYLHGRPIQTNN